MIEVEMNFGATWGGKHTSIDNLKKGVKSHLPWDMPGIAEEMIKEKLLLHHPTRGYTHYLERAELSWYTPAP